MIAIYALLVVTIIYNIFISKYGSYVCRRLDELAMKCDKEAAEIETQIERIRGRTK